MLKKYLNSPRNRSSSNKNKKDGAPPPSPTWSTTSSTALNSKRPPKRKLSRRISETLTKIPAQLLLSPGTNEKSSLTQLDAANFRPPAFHSSRPIPDSHNGCYRFDTYHANWEGKGAGYAGGQREAEAAAKRFDTRQKDILSQKAGLGESGSGDWNQLAKSGGLFEIDVDYLETFGFFQLGGECFTRNRGLRAHLVHFVEEMKSDYDAAYRGMSPQEQETLEALAAKYPSTDRAWDVEQRLDDRSSVLELYARSTGAARTLWDVMVGVAEAAGLKPTSTSSISPSVSPSSFSSLMLGNEEGWSELRWSIKAFGGRLRAKARQYMQQELKNRRQQQQQQQQEQPKPKARRGSFERVENGQLEYHGATDVLRGQIVFGNPDQLSDAMDFLFLEHGDLIVWVNNRLATPVGGYRDVLILLSLDRGHICELRFHLSLLYEVRDPYRAFSIARLLKSSPSAADQRNTYDGDYNAKGEYHGRGRLLLPGGEVYEGAFRHDKAHGFGTYKYSSGARYEGEFKDTIVDGKQDGRGRCIFPNGKVYDGEWAMNKAHGSGKMTFPGGDQYIGDYRHGKRHGNGTFRYASGNIYEGEYSEDKRHGLGTVTFASGDSYVGEWVLGKQQGRGKFVSKEGEIYEGEFKGGRMHGKGRFLHSNGTIYDGNWDMDMKHGGALFYWVDGEVDACEYDGNARIGEGVRWNANRKKAWRLAAGRPQGSVSLKEAMAIAKRLGIFEVPDPNDVPNQVDYRKGATFGDTEGVGEETKSEEDIESNHCVCDVDITSGKSIGVSFSNELVVKRLLPGGQAMEGGVTIGCRLLSVHGVDNDEVNSLSDVSFVASLPEFRAALTKCRELNHRRLLMTFQWPQNDSNSHQSSYTRRETRRSKGNIRHGDTGGRLRSRMETRRISRKPDLTTDKRPKKAKASNLSNFNVNSRVPRKNDVSKNNDAARSKTTRREIEPRGQRESIDDDQNGDGPDNEHVEYGNDEDDEGPPLVVMDTESGTSRRDFEAAEAKSKQMGQKGAGTTGGFFEMELPGVLITASQTGSLLYSLTTAPMGTSI